MAEHLLCERHIITLLLTGQLFWERENMMCILQIRSLRIRGQKPPGPGWTQSEEAGEFQGHLSAPQCTCPWSKSLSRKAIWMWNNIWIWNLIAEKESRLLFIVFCMKITKYRCDSLGTYWQNCYGGHRLRVSGSGPQSRHTGLPYPVEDGARHKIFGGLWVHSIGCVCLEWLQVNLSLWFPRSHRLGNSRFLGLWNPASN